MLVRVVGDTFVRTVIDDDTHAPGPEYHEVKFSFPMSNIALGKVGKVNVHVVAKMCQARK